MNDTRDIAVPSDKQFYSFEEFRLVYETTERLVERKMATTRANSSFSSAIIAGQCVALSWAFEKSDRVEIVVGCALLVIAVLGIAFSLYWYDQIRSSSDLNNAKFKVMSEIAQSMQFPDYRPATTLLSINPFEREWELMRKAGKLTPSGKRKGAITELIVPACFLIVFALEAVLLGVWVFSIARGWHLL